MGDAWRVDPLHRSHDKSRFDCGNPVLNEWLPITGVEKLF
jgi:hypothetical protein